MNGESNGSSKGKSTLKAPVDHSESYQLQSVDKANTPRGTEGEDWYRCVIAGNDTKIVSYQRGARDTVLESISRYLNNLNGAEKPSDLNTIH